jgi:WYL domain
MGNGTNEANWAARERLRAVEMLLWWRGWVGRGDLIERFGISAAQTSGDLQRYLELNETAMVYHTSRKRYEATEAMRCLLHKPSLNEAVGLLGGEVTGGFTGFRSETVVPGGGDDRLVVLHLPVRQATDEVARRVFMALFGKQSIRVKYTSVSSNQESWRVLRPSALAWDGRRWHVRAWCETRQSWLDFVLGRMSVAEWPMEAPQEIPADEDWQTWETVRLRVNPALGETAREGIKMDYGLADDALEIHVRRAMMPYLEAEMFLMKDGEALPRHFVIEGFQAERIKETL